MIAANELRIGNWVLFNGKRQRVGLIDLDLDDESEELVSSIEDYGNSVRIRDGALHPIPLTPEILEKAGWWAHMDGGYYLPEDPNDEDNLMPKDGFIINDEMDFHYEDNYAMRSIKLTSLHQLQNLYFALTGEELNINL